MNNLFCSLSKGLPGENYLTNALVALLTELLENQCLQQDKDVALEVLNLIAKENEQPDFVRDKSICIRAQVRADGEQPDVTISSDLGDGTQRMVYIEVKDRDDVRKGQLVDYRMQLDCSNARIQCLTLLCRPTTEIEPEDEEALKNHRAYWSEVYDIIRRSKGRTHVGRYLLDSFGQFMEEKNMHLKKVTGDCASIKRESLDDLVSLVNLLSSAMRQAGFQSVSSIKMESGCETQPEEELWSWVGFYGSYDRQRFSAGIYAYPSSPTELKLELQREPDYPYAELEWNELQGLSSADQLRRLQTFLEEHARRLLGTT